MTDSSITGNGNIGGLFGYLTNSKTIIIENANIEVAISLIYSSSSTVYLGGFFGRLYSSSISVSISGSVFTNANSNSEVDYLSGYNYNSS